MGDKVQNPYRLLMNKDIYAILDGDTKFEEYGVTHVIYKANSKLKMLISKDETYKELYNDSKFVIYERLAEEE